MSDHLGPVLHRATDELPAPGLTRAVLREAARRRARRRAAGAVVAAVLASVLVVGGATVLVEVTGDGTATPPATSGTTGSGGTPRSAEPSPSGGRELVEGTQPRWDPRRVDDLPAAGPGTVASLPPVVTVPSQAPALAGAPVPAAVLAVRRGPQAYLLAPDGSWRSVPVADRYPRLALNPSGTALAVWAYGDGADDRVVVHDLASGTTTTVGYPSGFVPFDFQTWRWTDDDTLLLDDGGGGWLVDVRGGAAARVAGPAEGPWTTDPRGEVVEVTDFGRPAELVDRAGGGERRVPLTASGRLGSIEADAGTVAGTSYDERPFSVLVVDRATARPRAVLPIVDPQANYGNGGLGVLALREDGTVLLRVTVPGTGTSRVVHWDPRSGALALVAALRTELEDMVTFADARLRGEG
ncbi:hypothetical protein QWY28_10035 [Nocardioides sp. SOB77]|uniref:WD40 repeat domain-containing protein n=1 Tax=Nocardioides oceani TaxID=3058369 RepID=A0ABT8FF19_9ACTN|nr:hypothetical protein [Nocardioides oceani]MDN4173281.1 hypothetical protein [Nocardioides oceani]